MTSEAEGCGHGRPSIVVLSTNVVSDTPRSLLEIKPWSPFVVSLYVPSPCENTVYGARTDYQRITAIMMISHAVLFPGFSSHHSVYFILSCMSPSTSFSLAPLFSCSQGYHWLEFRYFRLLADTNYCLLWRTVPTPYLYSFLYLRFSFSQLNRAATQWHPGGTT